MSFNDELAKGYWGALVESVKRGGSFFPDGVEWTLLHPIEGRFESETDALAAAQRDIDCGHKDIGENAKPIAIFHVPFELQQMLGRMHDSQITILAEELVWS